MASARDVRVAMVMLLALAYEASYGGCVGTLAVVAAARCGQRRASRWALAVVPDGEVEDDGDAPLDVPPQEAIVVDVSHGEVVPRVLDHHGVRARAAASRPGPGGIVFLVLVLLEHRPAAAESRRDFYAAAAHAGARRPVGERRRQRVDGRAAGRDVAPANWPRHQSAAFCPSTPAAESGRTAAQFAADHRKCSRCQLERS